MTAQVLRGWLPGLTTVLGCTVGCWLAVGQGQQEQALRTQQLSDEVALLRRALDARPPQVFKESTAGTPPAMAEGVMRLSAEDLEAMALRMASLLKESGGLASGSREPEHPDAPPTLSSEQRESATRAGTLVGRVVSSGRMTAEDVLEIRRELSQLRGRPEADEIRRRLVVAINQDRLIPSADIDGLP